MQQEKSPDPDFWLLCFVDLGPQIATRLFVFMHDNRDQWQPQSAGLGFCIISLTVRGADVTYKSDTRLTRMKKLMIWPLKSAAVCKIFHQDEAKIAVF